MFGELVTFKIATGWIERLAKKYVKQRGERIKELGPIADELMVIPQDLAPVYVEPDLQPYNPADGGGEEEEEFRVPALNFLEKFVKARKVKSDGERQLFILADAGMGKTSLLAMFKLGHVNKFWPPGYECLPIKLGPNTLERLAGVTGRGNTILLLDALDEDKEAIGRIKDRIIELLQETQNFLRVVITCRNQFLPLGNNEVFPRQDRIKLGGFTCPVKYVSPFSDDQVRKYLEMRFPRSLRQKVLRKGNQKATFAEEVIKHMDDLRFRPMLLANVDDLIGENVAGNPFLIYRTMVSKWLDREASKKGSRVNQPELLLACFHLARYMTSQSIREVNKSELEKILESTPELAPVKLINFCGRSLLNRNSEGAFRFAHQSIQEFLVIHALASGFLPDWPIPQEMMMQFLRFMLSTAQEEAKYILANLSGAKLMGANLGHTDMRGAKLGNADLRRANLRRANLSAANLIGANLSAANLRRADMRKADPRSANLSAANLSAANLSAANLSRADLSCVDLSRADLSLAILIGVNLGHSNLNCANLEGLRNWKQIKNIRRANISEVVNPPEGFREWALENGALETPPEIWQAWKEAGFPDRPKDDNPD